MKHISELFIAKLVVSIIVFLILIIPTLENSFGLFSFSGVNEKRRFVNFSELDFADVFMIPYEVDRYFNDNYGFRTFLIKVANTLRYYMYRVSPDENVIIGKHNWLFYSSPFDGDIIGDYKKTNLDSALKLKEIAGKLVSKRDMLRERGVEYILVLVPNKGSVYPEYLPDMFQNFKGESRYDRLTRYLIDHTDLNIVSFKKPLLEAKKELGTLLYEMNGSHWNTVGAFVGYRALVEKMQKLYPNIIPKDWSDYEIKQRNKTRGLETVLGVFFYKKPLEPVMVEKSSKIKVDFPDFQNVFIIHDEDRPEYIPKAIIFVDSFFSNMGQYYIFTGLLKLI
jgi:hypothetical protein